MSDSTAKSSERFVRQEMLEGYEHSVQILAGKKVGLVGVGGLGGLCALLLSNAGVGYLRLADGDEVEWHNLHRQVLFTEDDAKGHKSKIQGAAREISARNGETQLDLMDERVTERNFSDFAQDLDLILDVSDNAKSREKIAELAKEEHKNLLSGAVSGYTALIALFLFAEPDFVEHFGCYHCLTQGADINTKVGITGPIAASASSLVAHVALEYLLGHQPLYGKLLRYDFKRYALQQLRLTPDPSCPHCHHAP